MSRKKKQASYIVGDLQYVENKLAELKDYIDSHPINKLKDRFEGSRLIATREVQRADLTKALKEYTEIAIMIDDYRAMEDSKTAIQVRGDKELSPMEKGDI